MTSRRTLAKTAALAALSYKRIRGANDRVRLGFIGVGNRGTSLLRATREYADQQIVAVCDIRRDYLENAAQVAATSPTLFGDYRNLIARSAAIMGWFAPTPVVAPIRNAAAMLGRGRNRSETSSAHPHRWTNRSSPRRGSL